MRVKQHYRKTVYCIYSRLVRVDFIMCMRECLRIDNVNFCDSNNESLCAASVYITDETAIIKKQHPTQISILKSRRI